MEKLTFQKRLGKNLVRIRKEKNISQAELARECLKDKQSLRRVEAGLTNPTAFYLFELAQALKIPVTALLEF